VNPYRPLHTATDDEPATDPEDRILAAMMIVLGLVRLVPAIATAETFGTEVTIAALIVAAGIAMLVRR
jgi:hypothetical protein